MRWFRKLIPWIVIALSIVVIIYVPDLGPERYSDFSSLFARERLRQGNVGYSVAVCKNGALFYQESFGKDGAGYPLTSDTPMYLGPSSEILSGALLYSLSLQKRVALDDDITAYLPEALLPGLSSARRDSGKPDGEPAGGEAPITLRDLASHRLRVSDQYLKDLRKDFNSKISGLEAGELDPEGFVRERLQAGSLTRSRITYRVLGTVMEALTNADFDDLLQSELLIPLEMYGTTSRPASLQGLALGSGFFFGFAFPYDSRVPYIAAPADGIVTTAGDIAKFLSYITAPPRKGISSLPPSSVARLYQPLVPGGDTGFGWRIVSKAGDRLVFQGGSVEGFSSRIVIWPERNAGIAILSAQGGAIQSNVVLPLLTSAAEKILFSGSSPRLFPLNRALLIAGITWLVYILSLTLQTGIAFSWAKQLRDRRETGKGVGYQSLIVFRTIAGIAARAALLVAAPFVVGRFVGRPLEYHDLLTIEPGFSVFFILAMGVGIFRNLTRLVCFRHLSRG